MMYNETMADTAKAIVGVNFYHAPKIDFENPYHAIPNDTTAIVCNVCNTLVNKEYAFGYGNHKTCAHCINTRAKAEGKTFQTVKNEYVFINYKKAND